METIPRPERDDPERRSEDIGNQATEMPPAREAGLPVQRIEHLLNRYGTLVGEVLDVMRRRPELREPIAGASHYLCAEAYYGASHEGALHLDDVLIRRLHVSIETADRGLRAAEDVGSLVGEALGWDEATTRSEVDFYRRRVQAELTSQEQLDDASADAIQRSVRDLRVAVVSSGTA